MCLVTKLTDQAAILSNQFLICNRLKGGKIHILSQRKENVLEQTTLEHYEAEILNHVLGTCKSALSFCCR